MEITPTEEAKREISALAGGRHSPYEPVARKWENTGKDKSLVLSGLEKNDIQNLRTLLYRRFHKKNIIVRSAQQEDGTYKAVIRAREGAEYLPTDACGPAPRPRSLADVNGRPVGESSAVAWVLPARLTGLPPDRHGRAKR